MVTELAQRGWTNKRWTTKAGEERGGRPFDKTTLYHLLTNRTYTGVVQYQGQVYPRRARATALAQSGRRRSRRRRSDRDLE